MKIRYVNKNSHRCGVRKSTMKIQQVVERLKYLEKWIYAVPSIDLIEEVVKMVKEFNPNVEVYAIHSKTDYEDDKSVGDQIVFHLKNKQGLLIITQHALGNIHEIVKKGWNLVIDEVSDPTRHFNLNIKEEDQLKYIFSYVDQQEDGTDFPLLVIKDSKESPEEDLQDRIHNSDIVSRAFFTVSQQLQNLKDGKCKIYRHPQFDKEKFVFTSFFNPSIIDGFDSVSFLGALLEKTLLYQHWSSEGVHWEDDKVLNQLLRKKWSEEYPEEDFDTHSKPIEIYYCTPERKQSKNLLQQIVLGKTILEHFQESVLPFLNDKTMWLANLIDKKHPKPFSTFLEPVPYNNWGLNNFQDFNTLVYSAAYNKEPHFYKLLEHLHYEDTFAFYHLYQTIMRGSLRKHSETPVFRLFIPCLPPLDLLQSVFKDIRLIQLPVPKEVKDYKDQRTNDFEPVDDCIEDSEKGFQNAGFSKFKSRSKKREIRDLLQEKGYQKISVDTCSRRNTKKTYWTLYPDSLENFLKK